ncbi:MAG: cellulase family glycosylhydrolase [Alsobacter sp.]
MSRRARAQGAGPSGKLARVVGTSILDGDGLPLHLRGTNLGNWIVPEGYMFGFGKATAPWQIRQIIVELAGSEVANRFGSDWLDRFIQRDDLRYIRSLGLNLVRVPIDYRILTPESHPGLWLEEGFVLLDRLVEWCRAEGLFVLFDLHAAVCGQTGTNIDNSHGYPFLFLDEACRQRTADVWARVAARFAGHPTVIGYDLLNEPLPNEHKALNPLLVDVYRQLVRSVRAHDKDHILFLAGASWNTNFSIFDNVVLDENVVYTFHHYGAEPDQKLIDWFLSVPQKFGRPVFLGESGENSDRWVETLRVLLDSHGIGWAFWPYKKMQSTSSLRTYDAPAGWDQIVAYQERFDGPVAERFAIRPPAGTVRAALSELLDNIRFERTSPNPGYIRALGLSP